MEKCKSNRCIYIYEFEDNSVYIGLTNNLKKRNNQHLNKGPVYNHIKKTNLYPILTQLTDYIDMNISSIKEDEYIKKYKSDGFNILNKRKGGNLGGNNVFWTYEKCKEELIKYKTRKDAIKYCPRSYNISKKNKWEELYKHLEYTTKPNRYWTYEKCKEESIKYKTKKDFKNNCASAYNISFKNKWLDDICVHMISIVKPDGYWTYKNCIDASKDCKTLKEFSKKYRRAYILSLENDWLKDFDLEYTNHKKWTYDECLEVSKKCENKKEFRYKFGGAYYRCRINKWLYELFPKK
jgi:predicted GIY-YIG superfamily endonuclease